MLNNDEFDPVDMIAEFVQRTGSVSNAVYILRRKVTGHRVTVRWFDGREQFPVEVISVIYGYLKAQ